MKCTIDNQLVVDHYQLQCFREARDDLGRLMVEIVYGACYHLLSDYERRMDPVDLETVSYQNSCEAFAVGLHAVCHRPRLLTDSRPAPKCDFPECLVMVDVPPQLSQQHMAIMALWLRWDPFTDRMTEFDLSMSPEMDTRDLWQFSMDAWHERGQIARQLNEDRERDEKDVWMTKMEAKLRVFAEVDRDHYPDDLKAYMDELDATLVDETDDRETRPKRPHRETIDIKTTRSSTGGNDVKYTVSQEIERRQLEQLEIISNSLKYQEKPNELNPRRYHQIILFFILNNYLPLNKLSIHIFKQ